MSFLAPQYTLKGLWLALIALAFAILLALLAVQTVRLEGFKIWPLSVEGWKPRAERLQGVIDKFDEAQNEAAQRAKAELARQEQNYRDKAGKADNEHETTLVRVTDATDRYIADNRVCPSDRSASSGSVASSESGGSSVPEGVPAGSFVAVADSDVRACSALYAYALSAHEWANGLD